ncbi:LacI family transcriptional regulator (plasmid) [Deinococcus aetherius]|uniref:LacI family transcriptional regulator n=1 Tax=Deinococcus aetherius TaxID=200252 RepID=A0ABM8AK16_9DEIO|nr:LacI family DNA-binding transcriptional regulator [Deinococcus aetherius]BDP44164.1 LacI family transcriptional regulator [Deinococcus aetherius]
MSKVVPRNATIHDVAKRAGVSYQTVSRVINNHVSVAPATRQRVLHAIEELKYKPSLIAKGLVTRRSHLIGIVASATDQYGPAQIVQHVEQSARLCGYDSMLTTLRRFEAAEMVQAVARLQQFGVDGLVLLTPYDAHEVVPVIGAQVPFILIDATTEVDGPSVSVDQFEGGRIATEHLIELGHRQILHLGGPVEWSDADLRYRGYCAALAAHRLPELPRLNGDWSAQSGFNVLEAALAGGLTFTAVFAGNDQMALGAMSALARAGRRVPEDVSVVGFDGTPESAFYQPPLTTVQQNFAQLGRKSLEELIRRIQGQRLGASHHVFQPHLLVRATTVPPGPRA